MNIFRNFRKPSPMRAREDDAIIGWALHANGRVDAIKQGSGMYGSGFGEGAFTETAFGANVALTQSTFGWAAAYSVSTWVYRCIEIRKSAIHRMPWSIINTRTRQKLPDHPLGIALKRNRQKLFKKIEQSQLLYGESFIELVRNDYGYVSDLFWLNNLGMAVLVGVGRITGYSYTAMQGGHGQNFEPDQVAFMKTDNPFNDLRGMSPTEVVMDEVGIDKDVARVVRAYYANDTRVGLLLIPKTNLQPADSQRFMDEWKKQNQGVNKAGKPVLMPFDMTAERVQEPASLDDIDLRESTRREIAAAYGVPLSLAGAWDDANYQSLPEQRKSFYEETIIPECDNIEEFINADVMPHFDDSGEAEFQYDYMTVLALTEDAQRKNDIYSNRLVSGVITRAEARAALGHPVRDVDDVYYIPAGSTVVPANEQALVTPSANVVEDTPDDQQQLSQAAAAPQAPKQLPQPDKPKQITAQTQKAAVPCYVIMSLADNPAITSVQNKLKLAYPDVQWAAPDSFHVTMIYALSASEPKLAEIKKVLPKSINSLEFEIGPLATFEAKDNGIPLFLWVKPTDALRAVQSGLYGAFQSLDLELSDYSAPQAWHPHVTLGYVEPGKPIPAFDGSIKVRVDALICSVGNGDSFQNVYIASTKSVPAPQVDPLDELAAWEKKAINSNAIKATSFVCYVLPADVQTLVRDALKAAGRDANRAAIRTIFAVARKAIQQPPADVLDYWKDYDDLMAELGHGWLTDYMAQAFAALQPRIGPGLTPLDVQEALNSFHDEFTAAWLGADDTPGPLTRLILAGMGAAQEAITRGSAANPQRPVQAKAGQLQIDWDLLAHEARSFARQYLYNLIRNIDDTTRQQVQDAIAKWLESGAPLDELQKTLQQIFNDPARARLIAQTETTRAYAEGSLERYRRAEVQHVKWMAANDSHVCPICKDLIGTTAPIGEGFKTSKGAQVTPPAHPGCRCWLRPTEAS